MLTIRRGPDLIGCWWLRNLEPAPMLGDDFDFWDVSDEVYNAIRAAKIAAEGAAVRASARAALLHRAALALLGVSLLLGIAMLTVPTLRPWSGQAVWVLLLGLAAYFAIVAIVYWTRPRPSAPELRTLRRIRRDIARLLAEYQASRGARQDPVLIQTLADAIQHLDEQLIPALQALIEQRASLGRQLQRYDRGELHAPEPALMERLRAIYARLQTAITTCVQQAANAYAMLVAILQESDDATVVARARDWADGLLVLYDSLAEVLRGVHGPPPGEHTPQPQAPTGPNLDGGEVAAESDGAPGGRPDRTDADLDGLADEVAEALRRIRDRGSPIGCRLAASLPHLITATLHERLNGRSSEATPLEQAEVLRAALASTVRRLGADDDSPNRRGAGRMVLFQVIHGHYFEGKPTRQIMRELAIAEATFHRYRREGIRVVARELAEQEERLRRDEPDAASG